MKVQSKISLDRLKQIQNLIDDAIKELMEIETKKAEEATQPKSSDGNH